VLKVLCALENPPSLAAKLRAARILDVLERGVNFAESVTILADIVK
jgi:hypothetical protein